MTPERRREMVIRAALPLIAERGAAVTTQQVARAAGIGEATIFRVFPDKEALLDACVAEALDPSTVLDMLRSIDLDQPLADRLTEAVEALRAHVERIGTVIGALHASGHRRRRPSPGELPGPDSRPDSGPDSGPNTPPNSAPDSGRNSALSRDEQRAAIQEAVAELFAPERDRLRLPVEDVTDAFLAQSRASMAAGRFVDLFLNGALNDRPASANSATTPNADR
jgi:AcrR family transcriptional regulator